MIVVFNPGYFDYFCILFTFESITVLGRNPTMLPSPMTSSFYSIQKDTDRQNKTKTESCWYSLLSSTSICVIIVVVGIHQETKKEDS